MIEYIDDQRLRDMIIEGANSLEKNKQIINSLNVFPVPDGDTGTNMSLTIQSAVKEVKKCTSTSIEDIANALANGSLMGARGNSGVILSQLFRGFAKGIKGKKRLSTVDLAKALKSGSDTAYKAVMKPVEGTILTVARESAEKAIEIAKEEKNIVIFLEKVIQQSEDALSRTPEMLKVLKDAGVVDSGGKGLVYIYIGALGALTGNITKTDDYEVVKATVEHEIEDIDNIKFSYCTEFIINSRNANIDALKDTFTPYGDSLLVVGNENLVKVHIHTNNPGEVMEKSLKVGYLSDIKIDNMKLQYRQDNEEALKSVPKIKKKHGMVTVTMGDGLTKIFKDFGVDHVIEGGQTMNPSTEDFVKALDEIEAETIFILPNNSNIIMAANQAKSISSKNIIVIPTKTVPQGIAALLSFNMELSDKDNEEEMNEAIKHVTTGQITYAVRDTNYNDVEISTGDILGIGNSEIKSVGKNKREVSLALLDKLVTDEHEMITVFYGKEIGEDEANSLVEELESTYPNCDIEVYYGGQPLYYYIFSIEQKNYYIKFYIDFMYLNSATGRIGKSQTLAAFL
ncbi:DAK2 domain-containing protein [Alkaliphilus pronyensis]|uniref:DAK2 domain-containing protein n=1 Tax=Alkaliphilus pronyensis TaxID=1482732 RepID=UPI0018657038|nr:DAK2 domain-containing protein [Alkaliphilus pronyensis]